MILVADDKPRYRQEVIEALTEGFPDLLPIVEAADGDEAVRLFKNTNPQPTLAFLDLAMPGQNGVAVAMELWSVNKRLPVVFFTNSYDEYYVHRLARKAPGTCVFGYLLKDENRKVDLIAKTKRVLAGDCHVDGAVTALFTKMAKRGNLTDSDLEVLAYMALGLKDDAIATRLGITAAGVQARARQVYKKLDVDLVDNAEEYSPRTLCIARALERGLVNEAQLKKWRCDLEQNKPLSDFD